ncbi:MAG: hypothetical protein IMF04_01050, partial [Proteobacteria bacterium]|nr:hypothetical protein [Pseudomonadota bacterium]
MTMTDPILQMLAYELAGIFAALSIWLILRASKKDKQVQEDAAKAVKKLKRLKDQRLESLTALLAEKYGLVGDALSQTAAELQEHEQQVYRSLLNIFVEQDGKALTTIPSQVEQALNAGLDLLPVGGEQASAEVAPPIDNTKELQEQLEENTQKLDQIMTAISQNQSTEIIDEEPVAEEENVEIDVTDVTDEIVEEIDVTDVEIEVDAVDGADVTEEIEEVDVTDVIADIEVEEEPEATASDSEPTAIAEEALVSIDDIDALLEDIDVDIEVADEQDEGDGDGIDLSALDDDEEEPPKKTEAELVVATADSANSNSNQQQDNSEQSIESDTVEQEAVSAMDLDNVADDDINDILNQVDNVMDDIDSPEIEAEPENEEAQL